ncbi:MAG: hypothetical protein R2776_03060 [Flavobacteriaceae bacterium]|nr:hypothetical protein [Flavobacteriaceae bacterium]
MKKSIQLATLLSLIVLTIFSCKKEDDGVTFVPARDRAEEAPVSVAIVEEYLRTHFYNYEEFANPSAEFDFKIKFDTIAGDNASKIPLIDQVQSKTVPDRIADGVTYKLYYLNALEGGGQKPKFSDVVTLRYEGIFLNTEFTLSPYTQLFDSAATPISFDLTNVVNGFQDGVIEIKTSPTGPITDPDGTVRFEDFGVGAVFMPSGLGYYVSPPNGSPIPFYSQLIFTFQLYAKRVGDQDNDGIPTILEDLNGNQLEEDDDTDSDNFPNYFDPDDDNDGRPTLQELIITEYEKDPLDPDPALGANEFEYDREEVVINGVTKIIITTHKFKDNDGDGIFDHLDDDI